MGLLRRLIGLKEPETRRGAAIFSDFGAGPITGVGGGSVSARVAENIASVVACINAISGPISSVPALVFRTIPGGREEAPDHPVSRLIASPNGRQTWPDWMAFTLGQVLLHGNSISEVVRNADGEPTALLPIPWQCVQVQLLASGRIAFDIMAGIFPWQATGTTVRRLFEDEVFWLKDRSDDGYIGRSVLHRAPMVLKAALGIQEFSSGIWDKAAMPSGFLMAAKSLSPEAAQRLMSSFNEIHAGARNAGRVALLEEGLKFEAAAMTPEDSEVLESRRFGGEEICRLFSVNPLLAGDLSHGSFTNMETAGRWHSSLCLAPWVRRIEAEMSRSVFGADSDHHLMIDLSGLQRGDSAAEWQTFAVAIDKGILTVNEIRAQIGFNPLPAGSSVGDEVVPGAGGESG